MDSKMDEDRIRMIGKRYEKKIDLFRDFQFGKDLNQIKIAIHKLVTQEEQDRIPSLDDFLVDIQKEVALKKEVSKNTTEYQEPER